MADEEAGVIISIWRDVTERVRAEEELRKYRDHLEELVEERTAELARANEQLQRQITERKRAQETIQESEERCRSLFEGVPMGLYRTTLGGADPRRQPCPLILGGQLTVESVRAAGTCVTAELPLGGVGAACGATVPPLLGGWKGGRRGDENDDHRAGG